MAPVAWYEFTRSELEPVCNGVVSTSLHLVEVDDESWPAETAFLVVAPAMGVGAMFDLFLGRRHDYTGHFAARYGGTLGAMMLWLRGRALPSDSPNIRHGACCRFAWPVSLLEA